MSARSMAIVAHSMMGQRETKEEGIREGEGENVSRMSTRSMAIVAHGMRGQRETEEEDKREEESVC